MRTWSLRALVVLGIPVGLWHMRLAFGAIFSKRNEEPVASWLAVILGPGLTLLGVLIAVPKPKWGGVLLMFAATVAFAIFTIAGGERDAVAGYFQMFTLPSILLGAGFLILNWHRATPTSHAPYLALNTDAPRARLRPRRGVAGYLRSLGVVAASP